MEQYRFSAHAQKDLINIVNYTLKKWGKTQANIYIDGLEELAGNLAKSPTLGTLRNDLKDDLLSFPYQSHILFYTSTKSGITIIRILHQHQSWEKNI
ncbi:type II toxin-antitoxin system RelE/ParE family toxin [Nitrosomonas ureae]|uniref:Toxin n=1 Tax=Nitrosomonas ureae TaxID=44577 RepID=A0A286AM85_9PROT|nr:type II toxin-antitoxin system RelE/ParE family toxin [Nitrosomonas ureae]SOD23030.1 toxin ParE1/3/4 [Nitrosomonas ureae]